jgi:lipoprotein-anchoring transpeptidase ErfK/SrfK
MPSRRPAPWLVVTTLVLAVAATGCSRGSDPAPPPARPAPAPPAPAAGTPSPATPATPARPAAPSPLAWAAVAATDVTVWSTPARQRMVTVIPARHAFDEQTVFLVSQPSGAEGAAARARGWLRVMLPRRPNGSTGWIERKQVKLTPLHRRVEVDLSARRLSVIESNRTVKRWPVAIGRSSTPTPTGRFYITVKLRPPEISRVYGAWALGLSGYSNVLAQFGTGDGQIALHGTNNPGSLGRAASSGCVRLDNAAISTMAAHLPLGTPVTIRS